MIQSSRFSLSRRQLLTRGFAAGGLAALGSGSRALRAASSIGRPRIGQTFVVVVELDGGNDGLNTVVPRALSNYSLQRPNLALADTVTLDLNSGPAATTAYRLHPNLTNVQALYQSGQVAVVHKVGYPDPNGSHFESKDIWSTGYRGQQRIGGAGWIARYGDAFAPTSLGAVAVGRGRHPTTLGGSSNPLTVARLDGFAFDEDGRYRNHHGARMELIREILRDSQAAGVAARTRTALQQGHDLADQLTAAVDNFTSTAPYDTSQGMSRRLRDVAVLLQAGFDTRVFYTGMGGFDTHGNQLSRHAGLMAELDTALGAFAQDMQTMGIWNDCVVVVVSEFGRRNFENGSGGTDHGEGNCVLVLGGAVRGGLYGPDPTESDLDRRNLPFAVDFRTVYGEILAGHLGVGDLSVVFPEAIPQTTALGIF